MKIILAEDVSKFIPPVQEAIKALGGGMKKVEYETQVEVGDSAAIANVKGYWVSDLMRIDIKFRR